MSWGLYIHIPFCIQKCPYCGFVSVTGADDLMEAYVTALVTELNNRTGGVFPGEPATVYVGGGTPSLLPVPLFRTLFESLPRDSMVECTVEANPDSLFSGDAVHKYWLDEARDAGVNRISIGVQSLDDVILSTLGRIHTSRQAEDAVRRARAAGFENLSIDLMFGVPGQTMCAWRDTLERCIDMRPDHVSAYSLGIEEDTPYFERMSKGGLSLPDPEETADMYETAVEILGDAGLSPYEISNFARPGGECLHNSAYWDFSPYMGIGASAHSFDGSMRSWNITNPAGYIRAVEAGETPCEGFEMLDGKTRAEETIMLSLRTKRGLDLAELDNRRP
ncbi:MAG: radical SAM family heme chaperone HemW, partial [Candidatus Latescibacteria bacterium]|nr:radical SAM family heme chaperone HemW [Candidatus Latescibacterota bacterium]